MSKDTISQFSPELLEICQRLKKVREELGFTMLDLSKELGVAHKTVENYEKAKRKPSVEYILKLNKAFNVSFDYVFYGKGDIILDIQNKVKACYINELKEKYSANNSEMDYIMSEAVDSPKLREVFINTIRAIDKDKEAYKYLKTFMDLLSILFKK